MEVAFVSFPLLGERVWIELSELQVSCTRFLVYDIYGHPSRKLCGFVSLSATYQFVASRRRLRLFAGH